jgi:hypothetical protein
MNDRNRYRLLELTACAVIIVAIIFFIVFLIASGSNIVWLKILSLTVCILICGLSLAYLYLSRELMRPRSLWMSLSFISTLVCILFSLMLNFPSPNPLEQFKETTPVSETAETDTSTEIETDFNEEEL